MGNTALDGALLMHRIISIKKILTEALEEIGRDCEMEAVKRKIMSALQK